MVNCGTTRQERKGGREAEEKKGQANIRHKGEDAGGGVVQKTARNVQKVKKREG